jgi:hypothetical protein
MRNATLAALAFIGGLLLGSAPAGTIEDPPLAALQAAAAKGDNRARIALADRYVEGKGLAQDFAQAARLYRSAAEAGYPRAQVSLAALSLLGLGLPRDDNEAYFWLIMAAVKYPGEIRASAFESLGEAATLLSHEEKTAMIAPARSAWSRSAPADQ